MIKHIMPSSFAGKIEKHLMNYDYIEILHWIQKILIVKERTIKIGLKNMCRINVRNCKNIKLVN
jgi:hypothetical protein